MSDENKEQETRNPEKKFQEQEEITLKTEESVQKEQTTESPIFNALKSEEYSSTKERKPSLFERFTGARNKPATQNQGDSTQPDTSESSEADENADYLDIPSFLRRNNS